MRSFAVLLVVTDHALMATDHAMIGPWQARWIGAAGVYLFFVHTCMVLMWSLERHTTPLAFYARRILRIYPLAITTLLATLAFRLPIAPYAHAGFHFIQPAWREIVANLLLVQNLFRGNGIVGVLWTLPLELQMYLVLPFLFAFVRSFPRLWPLLMLWAAVCFYDRFATKGMMQDIMMCVPCFLPGIMGYLLFARVRPRIPAALFFLFLVVMFCAFMERASPSTAWIYCLCVGLALPFFRQIRAAWLMRFTHEIAEYSYSIYLMHLIGFYIGFDIFAGQNIVVRLGITLACTALLTVAAHRLVEAPGMRMGSRVSRWIEAREARMQVPASTS